MSEQIPLLYQCRRFHSNGRTNKSRLRQLLIRNELFFNSPKSIMLLLNAGFLPYLKEMLSTTTTHPLPTSLIADSIENSIDSQKFFVNQLKEKFKNRFFITCLSEKKNHLLMLAHYADNHKGYFIEFDFLSNSQQLEEWVEVCINFYP